DTELPPVHLWWFTAKGLEVLGHNLKCRVVFVNLEDFYRHNLCFKAIKSDVCHRRAPVLDEEYNINPQIVLKSNVTASIIKGLVKNIMPRFVLRQIQLKKAALSGLEVCTASTAMTLCARISKV